MSRRHLTFSVGGVQMTMSHRTPTAATSPVMVPGSPEHLDKDVSSSSEEENEQQQQLLHSSFSQERETTQTTKAAVATTTTATTNSSAKAPDPPAQGGRDSQFDDLDLEMSLSPLQEQGLAADKSQQQLESESYVSKYEYDLDMHELKEQHRRELEEQKSMLLAQYSKSMEETRENIRQSFLQQDQKYRQQRQEMQAKHEQETAQLQATISDMKQTACNGLEVDADVASVCAQKKEQYRKIRSQMRVMLGASKNEKLKQQEILEEENRAFEDFTTGITLQMQLLQAMHFNQQSKDRETIATLEYSITQLESQETNDRQTKEAFQSRLQTSFHQLQQEQLLLQRQQLQHEKEQQAYQTLEKAYHQLQQKQLVLEKEVLAKCSKRPCDVDTSDAVRQKDEQIAQLRQELRKRDNFIQEMKQRLLQSPCNRTAKSNTFHNVSKRQLEHELKQLHVTRLEEAKSHRFRLESMARKLAVESQEHVRKTGLIENLQSRLTQKLEETRKKQELIDELEAKLGGKQKRLERDPELSRKHKKRRV